MLKVYKFVGILITTVLIATASYAHDDKEPKQMKWHFDGPFGTFDRAAIQRGFQVYKEVCAACHGIKRVAFRNLEDIGFSKAEVKALASSYSIPDGPNDNGEMFERPGVPSDYFQPAFKNDKLARMMNNGALPPDLSLIVKARHDGPNYVYSVLTGYEPKPDDVTLLQGQHYNPYMPGGIISMAQALSKDIVTYTDGTPATAEQMAYDVVNFLQWTSEPEMEDRKHMGIRTMLYLVAFTIFFYLAKRRIWSKVK